MPYFEKGKALCSAKNPFLYCFHSLFLVFLFYLQGFTSWTSLPWVPRCSSCVLYLIWSDSKGCTLAWGHHICCGYHTWYANNYHVKNILAVYIAVVVQHSYISVEIWLICFLFSVDWNIGACLYGFQLLKSRVAALFVAGASRVFLISFGVHYWFVLDSHMVQLISLLLHYDNLSSFFF